MEFHESLTNLIVILTESLKLINKNAKFIAKITAFSLITPSILLVSFIYFIQTITTNLANAGSNQSLTKNVLLILAVEIVFLVAIVAISLTTNIAMIFVLASSYTTSTSNNLSSQDVLSKIKTTWRKQLSASRQISRRTIPYFILIVVLTTLIQLYPNFITLFVGVLIGFAASVYYLYYSVMWALSPVVVVVEESGGKEAVERAGVLVEGGQRFDGFVVNLFFNLVFLVLFFVYWLIMGGEAFTNYTVFGLFMMNCSALLRVFVLPAYTVLYFKCKKQRGEEIEAIGGFQYSKVATTQLPTDIV